MWQVARISAQYWHFTQVVDSDLVAVPIEVKLWDQDDLSADDQIDLSSGGSDRTLNLVLDLKTGGWSGEVSSNVGLALGNGLDRAKILFAISISGNADFDADGIPDSVERFGVRDTDGNLSANLGAKFHIALVSSSFQTSLRGARL
jgi:hypothetical protein